jgi:arylsulfatase A-like enzyme
LLLAHLITLFAGCGGGCNPPSEETGAGAAEPTPDDTAAGDSDTGEISLPGEITPVITLAGAHPKNVLVLSIDTLRPDFLNYFGYNSHATSPTLDAVFEGGVALTNHRSCSSWTFPSMLCAMTGVDQLTLGFWPINVSGVELEAAPDYIAFMAEFFEARDYDTMLLSGSGFVGASGNMDQGYQEGIGTFGPLATELVDQSIGFLQTRADDPDPWLLHLHLLDPHAPYAPPESYLDDFDYDSLPPINQNLDTEEGTIELWASYDHLDESAQAISLEHLHVRYAAEVRYTDDEVARLFAQLDDMGAWEDTLVVVYSDHGEEFYEHGNFNHGYTAYNEVTRVPAAFYQPGNLEPALFDGLTTHEDILPTLFAILGWDIEPHFTGAPVGTSDRTHLYNLSWRYDKTIQAVTDGEEKLIYRWGEVVSEGPAGTSDGDAGDTGPKPTARLFFGARATGGDTGPQAVDTGPPDDGGNGIPPMDGDIWFPGGR